MHRAHLIAVTTLSGTFEARDGNAGTGGCRRCRLIRGQAAHHQDVLRSYERAELASFLEGRHREAGRATLQSRARDWHRAEAVTVRLDDREQPGAFGEMREHEARVGTYSAEVDLRPAECGGQSPP